MALETALDIETGIVMLQETFIVNYEFTNHAFNFCSVQGSRAVISTIITIRQDLLDKIIAKHRTD